MNVQKAHALLAHGVRGAGLLEGVGAMLVFIGAYAPWVQTTALFARVAVRGAETPYARVLLLIPLVALGLLAWRWYVERARWAHIVILILGILTLTLATAYGLEVKRDLARAQESLGRAGQIRGMVRVDFDIGLYLTLIGGTAMGIGGFFGSRQDMLPNKA